MGRREELGARIRDAVDRHSNNGYYSEMAQAFFGMDVAAYEGVEPYTSGVVQGWMYGTILPRLATLRAIAAAASFDGTRVGLAWLVYGKEYATHTVREEDFLAYYWSDATATRR
jgi:hypothetical protein